MEVTRPSIDEVASGPAPPAAAQPTDAIAESGATPTTAPPAATTTPPTNEWTCKHCHSLVSRVLFHMHRLIA